MTHAEPAAPLAAISAPAPAPAPTPGRRSPAAGPQAFGAGPHCESGVRRGYAAMVTGAVSNQTGAALGAHAFDAIGPAGVVAVRQIVAALTLVPTARPRWRTLTWSQWWPALLLAGVFVTMSLSLYSSIDRVGLGLAVTLEFLGPLAVALLGSRRLVDLLAALAAGAGVYVLVLPDPSTDVLGIGLGLLAAACWASYILLNRLIGTRLPGATGSAVAATVGAAVSLPLVVFLVVDGRMTGPAPAFAVAAGLLSSSFTYALDLFALRHVTPAAFGLCMSIHPVCAALAGIVFLHQWLAAHEWLGILVVVAANAVALGDAARRQAPRRPRRSWRSWRSWRS